MYIQNGTTKIIILLFTKYYEKLLTFLNPSITHFARFESIFSWAHQIFDWGIWKIIIATHWMAQRISLFWIFIKTVNTKGSSKKSTLKKCRNKPISCFQYIPRSFCLNTIRIQSSISVRKHNICYANIVKRKNKI